jgi:hypothetical protein
LVLSLCGQTDQNHPAVPTNATSHWVWGDRAMRRTGLSFRYSVIGYVIHHCSSVFWATSFERYATPDSLDGRTLAQRALQMAAVAAFVDFVLTPRRFTPGFERRLTKPSLVMVYVSFGLGLAAGAWWRRGLRPPRARMGPAHAGWHAAGQAVRRD